MSVPWIERRWLLLAAGALLAPPFLSSCQGQTPAPATVAAVPPQPQPEQPAASSTTPAPATSPTPPPDDPSATATASAMAAPDAAPSTSAHSLSARECEALAKKENDALRSRRSCVTAAGCAMVQTSCGLDAVCGAYVSASAVPAIRAMNRRFDDGQCATVLPPMPCPTCPMPPPPVCVQGKCR